VNKEREDMNETREEEMSGPREEEMNEPKGGSEQGEGGSELREELAGRDGTGWGEGGYEAAHNRNPNKQND